MSKFRNISKAIKEGIFGWLIILVIFSSCATTASLPIWDSPISDRFVHSTNERTGAILIYHRDLASSYGVSFSPKFEFEPAIGISDGLVVLIGFGQYIAYDWSFIESVEFRDGGNGVFSYNLLSQNRETHRGGSVYVTETVSFALPIDDLETISNWENVIFWGIGSRSQNRQEFRSSHINALKDILNEYRRLLIMHYN